MNKAPLNNYRGLRFEKIFEKRLKKLFPAVNVIHNNTHGVDFILKFQLSDVKFEIKSILKRVDYVNYRDGKKYTGKRYNWIKLKNDDVFHSDFLIVYIISDDNYVFIDYDLRCIREYINKNNVKSSNPVVIGVHKLLEIPFVKSLKNSVLRLKEFKDKKLWCKNYE